MSAPWIKVRENLESDPRVLTIASMIAATAAPYILAVNARDLLGVTPTVTSDVMRDVTVTALLRVWIAANRHTVDGVFHHTDITHLDHLSRIPGFGAAMVAVGYAENDPETRTVTLPNFGEYNAPAKAGKGSKQSERQRRYRENLKAKKESQEQQKVTEEVTSPVTSPSSLVLSNSESLNVLESLKKRVNSLSPGWTKASHWGHEDEHLLLQAAPNLVKLTEHDWDLLGWFVKACISPSNGMKAGEELKLTTKRGPFVADMGSILDRANKHWLQLRRPPLRPRPPAGTPPQNPPHPQDRPNPRRSSPNPPETQRKTHRLKLVGTRCAASDFLPSCQS